MFNRERQILDVHCILLYILQLGVYREQRTFKVVPPNFIQFDQGYFITFCNMSSVSLSICIIILLNYFSQ